MSRRFLIEMQMMLVTLKLTRGERARRQGENDVQKFPEALLPALGT
jgi:hypothetical protein